MSVDELVRLRRELEAEATNGMKRVRYDWQAIREDYRSYKGLGLTTQESFYCALLDSGYIKIEDLEEKHE